MKLRFYLLGLLLLGTTVPTNVRAQHLPAFLQVRASDVPVDEAPRVRAGMLMAWGSGIVASMLPYAGVSYAMGQRCYGHSRTLGTQYVMYSVVGSAGLAILATGIARWRRLPAGRLSADKRERVGVVSTLAMATSLGFMSLMTLPEAGICQSS